MFFVLFSGMIEQGTIRHDKYMTVKLIILACENVNHHWLYSLYGTQQKQVFVIYPNDCAKIS